MSSLPILLTLPLELREEIYSYLIPRLSVSHPFPSVGITSVTHRPPPSSLLHVHPHLTRDVLAYFHAHATFKLIFSHAFNFFRVDPDLHRLAALPALQHLQRVEVVFFCDILLLKGYPSFGLGRFCAEIRRRAERACEVLAQARALRIVVVSWIDTTLTDGWEEKASVLLPLGGLARARARARDGEQVTFHIGEVIGPEDVDRGRFAKAMRAVLGEGVELETGMDGPNEDEPMKMRMLAFDPKQELH